MTTLYPRLSDPDARRLLAETRSADLDALRTRGDAECKSTHFAPTGGVPATREHLRAVSEAVRDCAQSFGYPGPPSTRSGPNNVVLFDRALTRVIVEHTDMTAAEAAAHEVWTHMAVWQLPDVVVWRWGETGAQERWLDRALVRHTFARLWWQAYALRTTTDAGYDYNLLDRLSESDLNQLFERRCIGGCPPLVRALAAELAESQERTHVPRRDLVRDVTKRIRRLIPFTSFTALDEPQLRSRMRALITESTAALAEEG